jgi:hypothetical protein
MLITYKMDLVYSPILILIHIPKVSTHTMHTKTAKNKY